MGLVRGGVVRARGERAEPLIDAEEFRKRFTEQHRQAIAQAWQQIAIANVARYIEEGMEATAAGIRAAEDTRALQEALRILADFHPPPYHP